MCGLCKVPSNRWTRSTKQFQFYKYYFRVSRLVALLSVQTARQTATHGSNQPGLSSNAVVFSTKTFSVSAFNAFSSAPPGENKAKEGEKKGQPTRKLLKVECFPSCPGSCLSFPLSSLGVFLFSEYLRGWQLPFF